MGLRQAILVHTHRADVVSVALRQVSVDDLADQSFLQAPKLERNVAGDPPVFLC